MQQMRRLGREGEPIPGDATQTDAAQYHFQGLFPAFRTARRFENAGAFQPSSIGQIMPQAYDRDRAVNAWLLLLLMQASTPPATRLCLFTWVGT
ncbi:MAG: hypothetical protein ACRED0_07470, partial [Gammaproteobacteria bacterium]